jgi:hypothetical protein
MSECHWLKKPHQTMKVYAVLHSHTQWPGSLWFGHLLCHTWA